MTEIQPASGLATNATINVKVLDVNEFNPKFSQDRYVGNVSEGAGEGTFIVQVWKPVLKPVFPALFFFRADFNSKVFEQLF